ncbi:MAG: alpha/beta hydrolase [Mojavia pulchra JT2-VF2]|uniref:Alpha/beta hydrolase n=1 Tax=Mojavia pulchra JT2-VF2 TaxID=287848 RepID=A0A951Q1P9_9NOST|nr:alpha/beta hydrolase [Mojavia pulchra JT2-VF2]
MKSQLVNNRIDLKDISIFYKQSGLNSNLTTPILFLHGWGISTEPYQEVLELLAQQHSLLAPDLPSFARSSYRKLIPEYDIYAKLLLSFLEALDIKQVHLVGHSIGGGIAITLSTLAPDKVRSMVLVDSTGIPSPSIPEMIPRRAIEMTAQISIPKLKLQLIDIPQVFSHNLLFNTGNVIQALLLSLYKDLRHLLPKITVPCLLLWSEKDLTTPLTAAQEMVVLIPKARLVTVEEGYHEWGLWYPEKFTSLMLDFIHQVELE